MPNPKCNPDVVRLAVRSLRAVSLGRSPRLIRNLPLSLHTRGQLHIGQYPMFLEHPCWRLTSPKIEVLNVLWVGVKFPYLPEK